MAELKNALGDLGLDTRGLKADLVGRLKDHQAGAGAPLKATANSISGYDPNEPTDDTDPQIPFEVKKILALRALEALIVGDVQGWGSGPFSAGSGKSEFFKSGSGSYWHSPRIS